MGLEVGREVGGLRGQRLWEDTSLGLDGWGEYLGFNIPSFLEGHVAGGEGCK